MCSAWCIGVYINLYFDSVYSDRLNYQHKLVLWTFRCFFPKSTYFLACTTVYFYRSSSQHGVSCVVEGLVAGESVLIINCQADVLKELKFILCLKISHLVQTFLHDRGHLKFNFPSHSEKAENMISSEIWRVPVFQSNSPYQISL